MNNKYKTLVFGASLKPYRYSHRAVKILKLNGYEVVPLGLRKGEIEGIEVLTGTPEINDIHTITMYVNASRQKEFYDYLLSLKPKRIIFNPGAENIEFFNLANEQGILCENACTLVLLSIGEYENVSV
ncbi:CoA-binding protein [Portibacter marinus]|uniref:CoA-binding protein n=1 Tax=Portibacter marinus TaxID=2898660 RepID=UPI001F41F930|nr:CoA-binding protein [Portibacter marinus]